MVLCRLVIDLLRSVHGNYAPAGEAFGTRIETFFIAGCVAIGDLEGKPFSVAKIAAYMRVPRTTVIRTLRPAIDDRDVAILDPAEFAQSLDKSGNPFAACGTRTLPQEADGRHLPALLRARRKRPRRCRTTKQLDELAPFQLTEFHSMPASTALHNIELAGAPGSLLQLLAEQSLTKQQQR